MIFRNSLLEHIWAINSYKNWRGPMIDLSVFIYIFKGVPQKKEWWQAEEGTYKVQVYWWSDFGSDGSILSEKHAYFSVFWKGQKQGCEGDWKISHYCEAYIWFFESLGRHIWTILALVLPSFLQAQVGRIFWYLSQKVQLSEDFLVSLTFWTQLSIILEGLQLLPDIFSRH